MYDVDETRKGMVRNVFAYSRVPRWDQEELVFELWVALSSGRKIDTYTPTYWTPERQL